MSPPRKLRIFHVLTRLNIGGAAVYNILLSQQLQNMGHEVWLVSGSVGAHEGDMLDLMGQSVNFKLVSIPELKRELHPIWDTIAFCKLLWLFLKNRPDIVHTHMSKAGFLGRAAAIAAFVPIRIHSFHGTIFNEYFSPAKTKLFIGLEKLLARFTQLLLADTGLVRNQAVENRLAPPERVQVQHLGLELDQFADLRPFKGRLRERMGASAETRIIGMVARLVPIKGVDCFLEAAAQVLKKHPDTRFAIAGDGELRVQMTELASRLGLSDRLTFLGFFPDLRELYADVDILALTSLSEGCPVSILEGMASGVPVVASAVGGVPDVVIPGETGMLFDSRDSLACAERICDLLKSADLRERLAATARTRIFRDFTIKRSAEETEKRYLGLMAPVWAKIPDMTSPKSGESGPR